MKDHKELDVWKHSIELVKDVYEITGKFPKDELYGLTNQIRRAAVSIPSNISEGAARHTEKEFIQFLYIALGSASELETQILISKELRFIDNIENELASIQSIMKMINGLIRHYKKKSETRTD
jgi:four helix bundle protein